MQKNVHGTTVAVDDRGVLIVGASGKGKSSLALQLIALGAQLVADDRTDVKVVSGQACASAPFPIRGLIEARGVGLLTLPFVHECPIYLVIDLDRTETKRLPDVHSYPLCGLDLPCLKQVAHPHFAASVLLYLSSMKTDKND